MAKAKARQRALAKKLGTTGHDPFIPARNARPLAGSASDHSSNATSRDNRRSIAPLRLWFIFAAWTIALALPLVMWTPQVGAILEAAGLSVMLARVSIVGSVFLGVSVLTGVVMSQQRKTH